CIQSQLQHCSERHICHCHTSFSCPLCDEMFRKVTSQSTSNKSPRTREHARPECSGEQFLACGQPILSFCCFHLPAQNVYVSFRFVATLSQRARVRFLVGRID